jgi:flagellar hook-length control protein FliK
VNTRLQPGMTNTFGLTLPASAPVSTGQRLTRANFEGNSPFIDRLKQMLQSMEEPQPSSGSLKGSKQVGVLSLLDGLDQKAQVRDNEKDKEKADPSVMLTTLLIQMNQIIQVPEKATSNNLSTYVQNQAMQKLNLLVSQLNNFSDLPDSIKEKMNRLFVDLKAGLNPNSQQTEKTSSKLLDELDQFTTLLKKQIKTNEFQLPAKDKIGLDHTDTPSSPLLLVNHQEGSIPHFSMGITSPSRDLQRVSLDVLREQLEPYFLNSLKVDRKEEVTKLFLQLEPEHLGKLEVTIQSVNGQIDATLSVDNPNAKKLVEDQLTTLKQNLLQQGIVVDRLEVTQMSENPNPSFLFQQQKQHSHEQKQQMYRSKKNHDIDFAEEIESVYQVPVHPNRFGVNYTI